MLLLLTVAVSSHAGSTTADRWLSVGIDWSHLIAAGVWTGGLLCLALAGLPAARASGQQDPEAAAEQAGLLTARFSDVAKMESCNPRPLGSDTTAGSRPACC